MKQSEWIKCSDRLPDEDSFVLIYSKDGYPIVIGEFCITTENWYDLNGNSRSVSHWQPLPDAPECD